MENRFVTETPAEYFKTLVERAIERQHLETTDLAAYYLVNLLCAYVRPNADGCLPAVDDQPLAVRLGRALEAGGVLQRTELRRVGDVSLFTTGCFSDSLNRKLVDVDYYVALGGYAYASLGQQEQDVLSEMFGELARNFVAYVDVLAEVSDSTGLSSNQDMLRLYEKWLRTGSRRTGQALIDRGIVPNESIGSRFYQ